MILLAVDTSFSPSLGNRSIAYTFISPFFRLSTIPYLPFSTYLHTQRDMIFPSIARDFIQLVYAHHFHIKEVFIHNLDRIN